MLVVADKKKKKQRYLPSALTEIKTQITTMKKNMPKIELKLAPVQNIGFLIAPYQTGFQLANIPIIGEGVCGSVGPVQGVDWILPGTTGGTRIGNRINPKKVTTDLQFCIDEQKSSSSLLPCPYQIRWWVIRVKGTNSPPGQGGIANGQNATWQAFFDLGNDVYTPPIGNVTDVYNKVNTNLYTVYKQGKFDLLPLNCKQEVGGGSTANVSTPSLNSKIFKHIRLDLTKYVAKTLKYTDDPTFISTFYGCNNDSLYITFNITRYDNQPIPGGQLYVNCSAITKMSYVDA